MRVVFAGSPEFSVPSLRMLLGADQVEVIAVYTQPDRGSGRGRKIVFGPVKQCALDAGIPVYQPDTMKDRTQQLVLRELAPDLMVVIAYGQILPQHVLDTPSLGCVNLHASLLPRWRGAAPIQRAIQAGDKMSGVTLMQMEAGLDTGPVLDQLETTVHPEETGGSLHDRLSVMSAQLLQKNLDALSRHELTPDPQDDSRACYAPRLDKKESALDFSEPAITLERRVRAFDPWPGTSAQLHGNTIRIIAARAQSDTSPAACGTILQADASGIVVQAGNGQLRILRLQKPGGKPLTAGEFLNGNPIGADSRFESA